MTPLDLDELERLAAAATLGPWSGIGLGPVLDRVVAADGPVAAPDVAMSPADVRFVAYARTAMPLLITRIRELEAAAAKRDQDDEDAALDRRFEDR